MSPTTLITIYVLGLLGAISGLALYADLRRRRFDPGPSQDHIFRCEKCGFVYTDDADVDRSRCPQCGKLNEAFNFY